MQNPAVEVRLLEWCKDIKAANSWVSRKPEKNPNEREIPAVNFKVIYLNQD